MNELQLLGPRAYGEPLGTAVLKAIAKISRSMKSLIFP